jgi:CubicO group peptidase (beta-lactamase class C family)
MTRKTGAMLGTLAMVASAMGVGTAAWALAGTAVPEEDSRVRDGVATIRKDLAPLIRTVQERFKIPGISVVLVRGNEVLWSEGFGLADVAKKHVATPDTLYRAGSLAKPLTAIAVMQLAEAGRIDIDQPLAGYLPEFSIRSRFDTTAEPITVRSVLSHHAGLPTDLNKGMWSEQPFTAVAAKLREEYAAFPPNLVFSYSNVGYTVLGHMVEKVSGLPYAQYMKSRVLAPLGMTRSAFQQNIATAEDISEGYRDGKAMTLLPMRDLPAAGLLTSAADIGRFMQAMLTGKTPDHAAFLSPGTLKEIVEPQNKDVALDLDVVVGLGWFLERDSIPGSGTVIRHGGTTLGFSSELILLPEKHLGVAVLANGDGSRDVTAQLAEEILARTLAVHPAPLAADRFVTKLAQKREDYRPAELAGNYATDFGLISIRPRDAKLCACIVEETFDLIPYPNGWFGVDQDSARLMSPSLRPLADMRFQTQRVDGRDVVVAMKEGKKILLGEKIPPTPVPDAWVKRVGKYELLNPDKGFPLTEPQVKIRDGQLCMSYKLPLLSPKTIQVPLQPISDTEAIILGLGRMRGETLRAIVVNGEERLRYSGFEGRHLGGTPPAPRKVRDQTAR